MGFFDFLNSSDNNNREERESWDYGSVSERHFGKDRFGYYQDEEDMYSSDERYDSEDNW